MGLRAERVKGGAGGTAWVTSAGGFFFEPVQRAPSDAQHVTLTITLTRKDFRLLEVLYDDVPRYIQRLIAAHVVGLVKSQAINTERQKHADKARKVA